MKYDLRDYILFENDNYIVINKPPNLSTLHERTPIDQPESILVMARAYHENTSACHRLDKETSGVLALSKHTEAYKNLAGQFAKRKVNKIYHALVEGIHNFSELEVDLPILKRSKKGMVGIHRNKGKEALTYFNTLEYIHHYTLLACKPVTGRMHQIRIHLAQQKAPIVGDTMYGGHSIYLSKIKKKFSTNKQSEEQPLIKRIALHAFSLIFTDINGEEIRVEAPYPKDFDVLLKQLKKWT